MIARTALFALVGTLFLIPAAVFPQDDPVETRVYNVELLTKEIPDWPGAGTPGLGSEVGAPLADYRRSFLPGEALVSLITSNIGEDSWSNSWASVEYADATLTVTNRTSVLDLIGGYIAYMKSFYGRMVVVDASLVSIDPELLSAIRSKSAVPGVLSPEQVRQIVDQKDKADVVRSMRATAYSGQRVCVEEIERHRYIEDYNVQATATTGGLFPIVRSYSIGATLDVRPIIETFGGAVTVEVRGGLAALEALEDDELSKFHAKIQRPRIAVDQFRTSIMIPEKQTAIVGLTFHGGRLLALLLTPSVVSPDEGAAKEPVFEEGRLLRHYDISALTRGTRDFPGPRLDQSGQPMADTGCSIAGPVDFESEGIRIEPGIVAELIKTHVANETWENARNMIFANGNMLTIRQKPEVLKEIDRYLASLLPQRARMIDTEAILIGFREGARADWVKEIPALASGGYFAEAEKVQNLLREAAKGGNVRVIERAEVTGYPQQRVHTARFNEETYIENYEPQMGQSVVLYDPVISTLRTGFVLDVQPHYVSGTDRIAVDLRSAFTTRQFKEMETTSEMGNIQLPELTENVVNSTVTCVGDKYTVASVKGRGEGGKVEEMVLLVRARPNATK